MIGLFTPIVYPINQQPWEDRAGTGDLIEVVAHAERLGYGFVTCGDHGAIAAGELGAYGTARFYDPVATLAYLAARTSTIRLATYIYQIHLRSPLITAKALATIDDLSGGRLIAGFGVGSRAAEAAAAAAPFESRGLVADEYLQAVLGLWTGEPTSFRGRFTEFADLVCRPRPRQEPRPPVWIAGKRLVSVRRALRFGDAWIMAPWTLDAPAVAELLGRARSTPEWGRRGAPLRVVAPVAPLGGRAPRGHPPVPLRAMSSQSAAEAVAEISRWRDAGATDFVLDIPAATRSQLMDGMAWCAGEVFPAAGAALGGELPEEPAGEQAGADPRRFRMLCRGG
jgi:probable F420-dependent oxidoreductase